MGLLLNHILLIDQYNYFKNVKMIICIHHIINSLYFIFYNKYLVASLTFYYLWHRFNQMLETSRDDFALC